jgi:ABC-type nitrate/sulfonate/bicarbonate transport system substrate-binding protein
MEWRRDTAGQVIAPSQVAAGARVMRTVAGFVIQLILAVATVCSRSASAADVTFITDFGYYGRHAYFYVALDKGYYKAENLDVNINSASSIAYVPHSISIPVRDCHP